MSNYDYEKRRIDFKHVEPQAKCSNEKTLINYQAIYSD